ncbi:hypothetical protein A2118_00700 [Candidatus Kaiserbacteria bacterium GWA2_50_9]|uniref:Uncharacterized protein n=1 Tax=Candidatus Kaiserbacteria bacterium GWA2_50_9 TaxID=1798474 RepID=A0A1F6BVT5_9BACT|nr:MAG: hypothetical protein A2118_00700 [Candidatus Kaiserbacteria bacterium GWA2_50_9]
MATRKELGATLTAALARMSDRIYDAHKWYAGRTYVGEARLQHVEEQCSGFREEIKAIEEQAKEYLVLAPEMESQLRHDVWQLNDAVRDFERTVQDVAHSTIMRERELDDPLRPTGRFARRTGPNELRTVHDQMVPVYETVYDDLLGIFPVTVCTGHRPQTVVTRYDNRGRKTIWTVYDHSPHRRWR